MLVIFVFLSILISNVRRELVNIGFDMKCELEVIKVGDFYSLIRMETDEDIFIVKYYEKGDTQQFVAVLNKIESAGIMTGLVKFSNKIIVSKDFTKLGFYRCVIKEDFKNLDFVRELARLYRKLHSVEEDSIRNLKDNFCLKNIINLVKEYHLENNELFKYIIKNFDNLKLKVDRVKPCLVVSPLSIENIAICKDESHLLICNLDSIHVGFRAEDLENVFSILDKELITCFEAAYGKVKEDEYIINDIVMCVDKLFVAKRDNLMLSEISKYLEMINSTRLLDNIKILVEWY